MKLNDIFYEDEYSEAFDYCCEHDTTIDEIAPDENGRRFRIVEMPKPTEQDLVFQQIQSLKQELEKWKEDVEQVELFGMERADYEEKKARCAEIILELRELEHSLEENNAVE